MSHRKYVSLNPEKIPDYGDSESNAPFSGLPGWCIAILFALVLIAKCSS